MIMGSGNGSGVCESFGPKSSMPAGTIPRIPTIAAVNNIQKSRHEKPSRPLKWVSIQLI
jgi:hypothetical protein